MFSIYNDKYKTCTFHFSGIGGVSMSGLAKILYLNHYKIQGSDAVINDNLQFFIEQNIKIYKGQKKENVKNADIIVRSLAIKDDNPEIIEAKKNNLHIIYRHELLSEILKNYKTTIAISGTHGKTTTSSMIGYILKNAGLDPSLNIGADLFYEKHGTHFSKSDYFVLEACEYGNSFLCFHPQISAITNIEEDHLDFFKDLNDIQNSFNTFAKNTKDLLIYNGDDKNTVLAVENINVNKKSFGFKEKNDYYAKNIKTNSSSTTFDVYYLNNYLNTFEIKVFGMHNIMNSLLSIAIAHFLNIPVDVLKESLKSFKGAKRRLEKLGVKNNVHIYDDYAHHPTEIKTSLSTLKNLTKGRLICIYQPHTYTRTKALYEDFLTCFKDTDILILADIYAAREKNKYNISSKDLANDIKNVECHYKESFEEIVKYATKISKPNDLIVSMGAGDIWEVTKMILNNNKNP